ncbi:hypothetical protein [Secundilactobacillus kimchicus]|uniref:hypothetical protein n=1 Tax=Secundilactobacillus kimchicus TaxID=528209 RepID=UPI0024A96E0B|nr:hypothetical protein [Secundilactobacillus kimchicus]
MKTFTKIASTIVLSFTLAMGGAIPTVPTDVQARTRVVYIAPHYGKKYHFSRHCRGLNNAGKITKHTLKWARAHHYTLCGWEK